MSNPFTTYIVKQGDTLFSIAAEFTGNEKRWTDLRIYNPQLAKQLDHITVGMRLQLPREWAQSNAPTPSVYDSLLTRDLRLHSPASNNQGHPRCVSFDNLIGYTVLTVDLAQLQQVALQCTKDESRYWIEMTNILGHCSTFNSERPDEVKSIHKALVAAFKAYRG